MLNNNSYQFNLKSKAKGNPNWKKGQSGNPNGRPKTGPYSGIKKVLHRLKREPIEELIELADLCKGQKHYAMAIAIWKDIHTENSEFPSIEIVQKEEKSAAKLLEEMEKDEPKSKPPTSSSSISMGTGTTQIFTQTNTEEDLRSDQK